VQEERHVYEMKDLTVSKLFSKLSGEGDLDSKRDYIAIVSIIAIFVVLSPSNLSYGPDTFVHITGFQLFLFLVSVILRYANYVMESPAQNTNSALDYRPSTHCILFIIIAPMLSILIGILAGDDSYMTLFPFISLLSVNMILSAILGALIAKQIYALRYSNTTPDSFC